MYCSIRFDYIRSFNGCNTIYLSLLFYIASFALSVYICCMLYLSCLKIKEHRIIALTSIALTLSLAVDIDLAPRSGSFLNNRMIW